MKVIVVGGGKVGYFLAQTLTEHGHEPHIVAKDKHLCAKIANELDYPVVCGDGTLIEVLEGAGARDAEGLVAVTGRDEDNLVACQLAKQYFGIKKTVARVNNPKNAAIMKRLGVDIPVSSTDSIARLLEREVDASAIKQLVSVNRGKASISELEIPKESPLHGKTLGELNMPASSVMISITRDGELIIPRGNTQLLGGDKVMVLCSNDTITQLRKLFML